MELTDVAQAKNLEQLHSLKRKKLVERHKGAYIATCYPENHLLPFENKLRSLDKTSEEFTNCSEFDFLYQGKSETPLSKKGLRGACEALYRGSDKGEDYFSYAKGTISKHIKTITGKSLAKWLEDKEFGQDAFKTAYLLYDLHLATPSGLEMLTKNADPRFSEVELFTSHHQPKNRNATLEDDQVIVLSAWLKELFSKTLFQRSEIERGMAKNLDLIFTGYHRVHQYIDEFTSEQLRAKLHSEVFDEQILARTSQPREPLSTKLMRAWQSNVKYHNLSNQSYIEIESCFLKADKPNAKLRTTTAEVDNVLLLGARLFSWLILQNAVKGTFHQLSVPELHRQLDITKSREKFIYVNFINDYQNRIKLRVKGIGEDSKKTSLFNSLKALVDNNRSLLEANQDPFAQINHDNNCETHYSYLQLRALFACQTESISAQEFLSRNKRAITQHNKTTEYVENYINSMTLDELNSDINRINKVLAKYTGSEFRLLPPASETEALIKFL
ncbi:hypothetical protein C1S86_25005 [Vibrio parahaemolyticus]|uniref:hypothetical protein n=1 Tax=Vibrio parahaemolyticus TaxID=670 RepID=UPI000991DAAB|nr:hypothetical protein [Vibrio parahaemolyticus]EHI9301212.1 hypothetical protein [Vibrio vulnificus]MBY7902310.1 hypothetical protein [Vibrio fluvialis]EHK9054209.1 hypothetical protein [Vibrio vulnificus]EHR7288474.1 hypothetical protein [Vibrio parahaemolyticus]ELP4435383.1 hypothetical protein [Vibrio vulnificus]